MLLAREATLQQALLIQFIRSVSPKKTSYGNTCCPHRAHMYKAVKIWTSHVQDCPSYHELLGEEAHTRLAEEVSAAILRYSIAAPLTDAHTCNYGAELSHSLHKGSFYRIYVHV